MDTHFYVQPLQKPKDDSFQIKSPIHSQPRPNQPIHEITSPCTCKKIEKQQKLPS